MFVYGAQSVKQMRRDNHRLGLPGRAAAKQACDDCRVAHRLIATVFAVLALGVPLAGCGSDSKDSGPSSEGGGANATVPGGAESADVEVIDGWATALKAGNIEKAASYWELPSTASNGTPPLELNSEAEVIAFNESLPCGAELVEATSEGDLTTATFELTERPGGGCGPGAGGEASTVFKIEDGKIVEWRRGPDPGGQDNAPPAPGQSV